MFCEEHSFHGWVGDLYLAFAVLFKAAEPILNGSLRCQWSEIFEYLSLAMTAKATNDPERRRYPRVKTKLPVELRCAGKSHMRTTTDEVSLCGCYIETMFTIEIGTKVELVLSLNQGKVIAKGVVVTKTPQVGNGIDFVNVLCALPGRLPYEHP